MLEMHKAWAQRKPVHLQKTTTIITTMVARRMDVIITTETTMGISILERLYAMNATYVGKLVTANSAWRPSLHDNQLDGIFLMGIRTKMVKTIVEAISLVASRRMIILITAIVIFISWLCAKCVKKK
jgi:hypothetical protein